jgi:hypothetical protein
MEARQVVGRMVVFRVKNMEVRQAGLAGGRADIENMWGVVS